MDKRVSTAWGVPQGERIDHVDVAFDNDAHVYDVDALGRIVYTSQFTFTTTLMKFEP